MERDLPVSEKMTHKVCSKKSLKVENISTDDWSYVGASLTVNLAFEQLKMKKLFLNTRKKDLEFE